MARAAIGVVIALVACVIGLMIGGAGHGWVGPLLCSLSLILLAPLVLIRDASPARHWGGADATIVAIAILLDIALTHSLIVRAGQVRWLSTESIVPGVDRTLFPFLLVWLVIWLGWQFVAMRTLWRDLARSDA